MHWAVNLNDQAALGPQKIDQERLVPSLDQHIGLWMRKPGLPNHEMKIELKPALEICWAMSGERLLESLRSVTSINQSKDLADIQRLQDVRLVHCFG